MSITEKISRGVVEALTKAGLVKPTTDKSATEPVGAITAEIQEAIHEAVATEVSDIKSGLQAQLTKAQENLTAANGKVTEHTNEISRLSTELQTAKGKVTAAETEVTNLKAGLPTQIAQGVAETAAAQGSPAPLPVK